MEKKYEYVVVGSGAGGATVARELSRAGKSVLVIEQGKIEEKVGTFLDCARYYDGNSITRLPRKSNEGVIVYRALMAGGTTVVSIANGVRCLEKELAAFGLDLEEEFQEAENEMGIGVLPDRLLSDGGLRIREAARSMGHAMENMPKFIDLERCKSCGHCSMGCVNGAKWTALKSLEDARQFGAEVRLQTTVQKVIRDNGRAVGVLARGPHGQVEIQAETVVLAAGGIGTPVILQQSGVSEAGTGLFIDILVNTYGLADDFGMMNEPQMALVDLEYHHDRGFLLSSYINHPREMRAIELGLAGLTLPASRLIGMMTKISDDSSGRVFPDGSISKAVTPADQVKISEGTRISSEILVKAGARPDSIRYSVPQGAHPGGTAAIGRVVNEHLMTGVKNLYVCDASVLPQSPGMPPILTIVALGKRLGRELAAR